MHKHYYLSLGSSWTWARLRISHKATSRGQPGLLSSEGSPGEAALGHPLTRLLAGASSSWAVGPSPHSVLCHVSLHKVAHDMAADFSPSKWENRRVSKREIGSSFPSLRGDTHCCGYIHQRTSLGLTSTQEETDETTNYSRESWDTLAGPQIWSKVVSEGFYGTSMRKLAVQWKPERIYFSQTSIRRCKKLWVFTDRTGKLPERPKQNSKK